MHVWPSGAGEPEGQSRAGGLLRVSKRVPYFHTSRGLSGDTVCNTEYATGGKGVMEVTTRLLSFMHNHGLGWRMRPQSAPAHRPQSNVSLEKCSVNASMQVV